MHDSVALIGNFIIVIGLLLLTLQVIKNLVPGPYRFVQRTGKSLAKFAFLGQAKKRGWLFATLVHLPFLSALALFVVGIITVTWQAILAGVAFATLTILAKRGLASLNRLRSRRRSLPGWRR
jgi:hypothetical protein